MVYLITGATGNVGSLVVERLIARGDRPSVFARDPEKARARYGDRVDVLVGDLADAAALKRALTGADALLLVSSGPELAARAAGVKHLVKLSSYDTREQNIGTGVWHAHGESAIRASGIPVTFIQPSGFMSNAFFFGKVDQGRWGCSHMHWGRQDPLHSFPGCRRHHNSRADVASLRRTVVADHWPGGVELRRDDREDRPRDRKAVPVPGNIGGR
jgi:uncharacterized protein YbjT (DUF2867 family)